MCCLLACIGEGNYGEVYKARGVKNGTCVCVCTVCVQFSVANNFVLTVLNFDNIIMNSMAEN